jgi:NADH-quinone oxidoreductase subunit H
VNGVIAHFVIGLVALFGLLNVVPILIYAERRICGFIQNRTGPNRVHLDWAIPIPMLSWPKGILQPLADAIKLATQEEIVPARADRFLFTLAPLLAMVPAASAFAFIPFGNRFGEWDLRVAPANVGVLGLLAVTSLGVYGIAFGGWASNSKYPLMGSVRSTAQLVSYAIAMEIAIVSILATAGSLDLQEIVRRQCEPLSIGDLTLGRETDAGQFRILPNWFVFKQPIAFLIFMVAAFAENNRLPFDLPEAEPELVAGYHTEYTGLKFALFFMGEYLAMVTMGGLAVTLFLGGWDGPGIDPHATSLAQALLSVFYFCVKLGAVLFFYIWVRWTLPRFRYDQLMRLGWRMLVPLGLANLVLTGVMLL